jgi:hypothetical protein
MAGQGRSVEQWNALAPSTRRRWIAAFGSPDAALEAYRNGASLTPAQRGHAFTPERPINALLQPWKFPRYVATHTEQLNTLAKNRGVAQHGTGPRGETVTSYAKAGGDFTWVIPDGSLNTGDWRFSTVFRTVEEAQLFARRSWAPAGVVMIVDKGPEHLWRYEVWFGYPEGRKAKHFKGGRMLPPETQRARNVKKISTVYKGKEGNVNTQARTENYEKQNKGRALTPAQKKRISKKDNQRKKP